MTLGEWNALRAGDIVIERRSKTPRLVLSVSRPRCFHWGKRKGQPYTMIELRKLRGSQYACPTTTLNPHDWAPRLDVAHGRRGRVLREFFFCTVHGYWHQEGGPVRFKRPRETPNDRPRPLRKHPIGRPSGGTGR